MSTTAQSQSMLDIPDEIIGEFVLLGLHPCYLGYINMVCVKLRQCVMHVTSKIAREIKIIPRTCEDSGSILFAVCATIGATGLMAWGVNKRESEVLTFGNGENGQLGHGTFENELVPRKIETLEGRHFVQAVVGCKHMALLTGNSEVFTFGYGEEGQLGHGGDGDEPVPLLVKELFGKRVLQITVGEDHTCALTKDGKVFTFGNGGWGQLGHAEEKDEPIPRTVQALGERYVVHIAAGRKHTAALTSDGEVFTFGDGDNGRLGHGDDDDEPIPRRIESLRGVCGMRVVQISAGCKHTVVLTSRGTVFTFGCGKHGQLGHSNLNDQVNPQMVAALCGKWVTEVAAGDYHTICLTNKGEVFTFGWGEHGQLGHGNRDSCDHPQKVQALATKRVVQIAAGLCHTIVLSNEGEAFSFGGGSMGRLGHGTEQMESLPRRIDALLEKRVFHVAAGGCQTVVVAHK